MSPKQTNIIQCQMLVCLVQNSFLKYISSSYLTSPANQMQSWCNWLYQLKKDDDDDDGDDDDDDDDEVKTSQNLVLCNFPYLALTIHIQQNSTSILMQVL